MLVVGSGQLLCRRHTDELIKADGLNVHDSLLQNCHNFQTAQGINFALGGIFRLLAANYISARRASVLTFICSQLLRTLPAIDADNAAGIKGPATEPTPPEPKPAAAAQPAAAIAAPAPKSPAQPSPASPKAQHHIPTPPANAASAKPAPPVTIASTNIASPSPQHNSALPSVVAPSTSAMPSATSSTQLVTSKSGPHLSVAATKTAPTKAAPPIAAAQ